MQISVLCVIAVVFSLSLVLTWGVRRIAMAVGIIDQPNARSSHTIPTPRGGGLSIVVTTIAGTLLLCVAGVVDMFLALAICGGGAAVAIVGFMDDRGALSVTVRMTVHIAAAIWAMFMLDGLPAIQFGSQLVDLGIFGDILGTMVIIWTLNLFNFMDGIDGIAASEAVFVTSAAAFIFWLTGSSQSIFMVSMLLASASLGFLFWNWPPAKIFMGDVGSGYLGYVIAVLIIGAARDNPVAAFVWLTLGGVFFVDATMTLMRRLIRRERVYQAHRSHAYQWLSRRWSSHLRVTLLVLCINGLWLLPMAWLCSVFPSNAWWISICALTPLGVLAVIAGAGRPECSNDGADEEEGGAGVRS